MVGYASSRVVQWRRRRIDPFNTDHWCGNKCRNCGYTTATYRYVRVMQNCDLCGSGQMEHLGRIPTPDRPDSPHQYVKRVYIAPSH